MGSVAIVTDSTSDLTRQLAEDNQVSVMPLSVLHKEKVYRDGVDITPEAFYPLLESSEELPTTSQPTPASFACLYERLLQTSKEIISFHLSEKLSSTVQAARTAAANVARERIHVVDSGFLSYALTFQVLEAARLAKEGLSASKIVYLLSRLKEKTEMYFTVDTLHYLYKGGRIGKVSSLMGSILKIKPVVRIVDGEYIPFAKARNLHQALISMTDALARKYRGEKVMAAVGHGKAYDKGLMLMELARAKLNLACPPSFFEVGPVIGVHTGPGCVGIAVRPVTY